MSRALSMVGTFSKHPRAWGLPEDLRVIRGNGVIITLSDGGSYLDWVCGLGANLLGYGNEDFTNYISGFINSGVGYSLPHFLEDVVAKDKLRDMLVENIPAWKDRDVTVRFAKTGSEANAMAIRLARAYTNRENIATTGYTGWLPEGAIDAPAHGIPSGYKVLSNKVAYGDSATLDLFPDDVACMIIEHGVEDPHLDYYDDVRKMCDRTGTLFILDEVVTGIRFGLGGVAGRYNVDPDIITMGKALGNGFPISAVIGRKEIMDQFMRDDPVFCSSTHWGETASLAAADWVLSIVDDSVISNIWKVGSFLKAGLKDLGFKVVGHPPRSLITFVDDYHRACFIHDMRARGVLMNRPNFVCGMHTEDHVHHTLRAAAEASIEYKKYDRETVERILVQNNAIPHVLFKNR